MALSALAFQANCAGGPLGTGILGWVWGVAVRQLLPPSIEYSKIAFAMGVVSWSCMR